MICNGFVRAPIRGSECFVTVVSSFTVSPLSASVVPLPAKNQYRCDFISITDSMYMPVGNTKQRVSSGLQQETSSQQSIEGSLAGRPIFTS
jgi:hypothetical protein